MILWNDMPAAILACDNPRVYPGDGELLHFSEDPLIAEFVPHVAATAGEATPFVWAVDVDRSPDYWFPRDCPRVLAWVTATTSAHDRALLGVASRVHVIEYDWLERMRTVRLFAYRLPAASFEPFGEHVHAYVSTQPVRPIGPAEAVGELFDLHDRAGIDLRAASNLWPSRDDVEPTRWPSPTDGARTTT